MKKLLKLHRELQHFEKKPNYRGLVGAVRANGTTFVNKFFDTMIAMPKSNVISNKYLIAKLEDREKQTPKTARYLKQAKQNVKDGKLWFHLTNVYPLNSVMVRNFAHMLDEDVVQPLTNTTNCPSDPKTIKKLIDNYKIDLSNDELDLKDGVSICDSLDMNDDFVATRLNQKYQIKLDKRALKNIKAHNYKAVAPLDLAD